MGTLGGKRLTKEEIICFIGILLVSVYHPVPFRRLYWSHQPDVYNQLVAEPMRRNRFGEILHCLHFADNSRITLDCYYKIRPLFTEINKRFKTFPLSPDISKDETMITYNGKHGSKEFIRGKPIAFGFKMFSLASPNCYLYNAESYCGADTQLSETLFGLGGNVVLSFSQVCDLPIESRLYFDN